MMFGQMKAGSWIYIGSHVIDPDLSIIRHADAGYDVAQDYARKFQLDIKERLKNL